MSSRPRTGRLTSLRTLQGHSRWIRRGRQRLPRWYLRCQPCSQPSICRATLELNLVGVHYGRPRGKTPTSARGKLCHLSPRNSPTQISHSALQSSLGCAREMSTATLYSTNRHIPTKVKSSHVRLGVLYPPCTALWPFCYLVSGLADFISCLNEMPSLKIRPSMARWVTHKSSSLLLWYACQDVLATEKVQLTIA